MERQVGRLMGACCEPLQVRSSDHAVRSDVAHLDLVVHTQRSVLERNRLAATLRRIWIQALSVCALCRMRASGLLRAGYLVSSKASIPSGSCPGCVLFGRSIRSASCLCWRTRVWLRLCPVRVEGLPIPSASGAPSALQFPSASCLRCRCNSIKRTKEPMQNSRAIGLVSC
jgi:hypothetical protein